MIHINYRDFSTKDATAITIGNFDGLHLGHQRLLNKVIEWSKLRSVNSAVFSFYPHPASILNGGGEFKTILTSEEKAYLLKETGLDFFIEYPFDKSVAEMEPEDFVRDIFVKDLKCAAVVIGEGYRFGRQRKGDWNLLVALGEKYGFEVISMPHLLTENGTEKVSSAAIRDFIRRHDFTAAEKLLSRPYFLLGEVVGGRQIGNKLGIPTANISPDRDKLLPQNGVYLTKTHVRGKVYNSITNIGTNPTVGGGHKTVETHILDFCQTIYGERIRVDFCDWLRGEIKFPSLRELMKQICLDIEKAKNMSAT